jgi:PAS domain S-box-containing protein
MTETKTANNGISKQQENRKSPGKSMQKKIGKPLHVEHELMKLNHYRPEKDYQNLFNNSQVLILSFDGNGRISLVNPASCSLLEYDELELLGKYLYDLMPEKEQEEFINGYLPALKRQGHYQGVLCLMTKQAERVYLLADCLANDDDANNFNCFSQNITTRVQQEEKMAEEMRLSEVSAQAKQNFLANLSHEIRTPMNGILGISSLLGKTTLNERQHNFLKLIQDSANNLLVIVNDVLDLEKIVAGKLQLEKLPFQIIDKISNIVQSFIYRAEEKGLATIYQNNIPGDLVVVGDPFRLTQVLNNLLNNALKFTEHGRIIITTRINSIAYDIATVECSIKDTGIGISESIINKIFEPFVQANSTITRKYGGTGLGLSICKNLLEIQEGSLSVKSEENKGSVFTFKIPYLIGEESIPADLHTEINYSSLGRKKILVVEDMELNQFIARHIMESWGFEVSMAGNGSQAINMVKQNDYDLILMDIQMPEMNGMVATRLIRKLSDPQKANLPIIALTGNSLNTDSEKYIAAGMNDYLAKPLSEAKLFQVISANLKNDNINSINMKTNEFSEPVPVSNQKLYDLSTIREISGGDEEFVQTMVSLFIDTVPSNLKELNAALQNKNWDLVSKMAHKLKSTLDSMGIHSIGQDIRTVEQNAKVKESVENIPATIFRINDVIVKCIEQIEKDFIIG